MIYVPETKIPITGAYAMVGAKLREITAIYRSDANGNLRLIYGGAACCFSTGPWLDEQPWINDYGWKNE